MKFLRLSLPAIFAFVLSGCMFVPFFEEADSKKTSKTVNDNMARLESEQEERMRANSNIRAAEYEKFHPSENKLPPKPTTADLAKIVEAEKQTH